MKDYSLVEFCNKVISNSCLQSADKVCQTRGLKFLKQSDLLKASKIKSSYSFCNLISITPIRVTVQEAHDVIT